MRWRPAHETHAIERVTALLQFKEAVQTKRWQTLLNEATAALSKLGFTSIDDPEVNIVQLAAGQIVPIPAAGAQIAIGPAGVQVSPGQPATMGRTFQFVSGNEIREAVSLSRYRFLYTTTRYNRWAGFRERINVLIGHHLNEAIQLADVNIVKLEYWDRFAFEEQSRDVVYQELFRLDSPHLPSFPYNMSELWHSHVGYFASAGVSIKRLINLNVDVLDLADGKRSAGIYTMAQDTLEPDASPPDAVAALSTLDTLHTMLKAVLRDVITAEAAERISLNAQVGAPS